jgi:hypothetical protein
VGEAGVWVGGACEEALASHHRKPAKRAAGLERRVGGGHERQWPAWHNWPGGGLARRASEASKEIATLHKWRTLATQTQLSA